MSLQRTNGRSVRKTEEAAIGWPCHNAILQYSTPVSYTHLWATITQCFFVRNFFHCAPLKNLIIYFVKTIVWLNLHSSTKRLMFGTFQLGKLNEDHIIIIVNPDVPNSL